MTLYLAIFLTVFPCHPVLKFNDTPIIPGTTETKNSAPSCEPVAKVDTQFFFDDRTRAEESLEKGAQVFTIALSLKGFYMLQPHFIGEVHELRREKQPTRFKITETEVKL